MAWVNINVKLDFSATSMPCEGGTVTATLTVMGTTDATEANNHFVASLRDDHVISDMLWDSGPQQAGPSEHVERHFDIALFCNKRCHVAGPGGSSYERIAEIYAHVLAGHLESQSDDISIQCEK